MDEDVQVPWKVLVRDDKSQVRVLVGDDERQVTVQGREDEYQVRVLRGGDEYQVRVLGGGDECLVRVLVEEDECQVTVLVLVGDGECQGKVLEKQDMEKLMALKMELAKELEGLRRVHPSDKKIT
ncbi:hypothetical protein ACFX19_020382 [Malus domestica]